MLHCSRYYKDLRFSETTVCYFKNIYLEELSKRVKGGNSSEITKLDVAERGRKVVLGGKSMRLNTC